ncbi:MAG: CHAT domain-containing protein, partial [Streptosporangiaceae bacterium]
MPRTDAYLVTAAERAVTLASADPRVALSEATRVLDQARGPEVRAVAERALGLSLRELSDIEGAYDHLSVSVRMAADAGLGVRAAQARMSLMAVIADRGDTVAALAEADRAAHVLQGVDGARLLSQRGMVLARMGRFNEALDCYRRAVPRLRRGGDARFEAGSLANLAAVHVYRGDTRRAERALRRSLDVAQRAGLGYLATLARWNLAFTASRRGDIPRALALFDAVERDLASYAEPSWRAAQEQIDRAETLLAVHLVSEARAVLADAISSFESAGFAVDLAEARLMLAQTELFDSDPAAAARTAEAARAEFASQGRAGWEVLARHFEVFARWATGDRSRSLLDSARRSAEHLTRSGWEVAAAHARILVGRLAIEWGDGAAAERELLRTGRARHSGPVHLRVAAWHATALYRLAEGDDEGTSAALEAGLEVVDQHAAALGATDLRAHVAGWGQELASLGVRLALQAGRPERVLAWVERWRAGALRHPPVRPPGDSHLARDLAELRYITAEITRLAASGNDTRGLREEQMRLEGEVRRLSRHAEGGTRRRGPAFSPDRLAAALGTRAFVAFVQHSGQLYAVTMVDGAMRLTYLCAYGTVLWEVEALRFFLHRLARRHGSTVSLTAAREGLSYVSQRLDQLLFQPLRGEITDRPLVMAPTGRLHALPWPALAPLSGRPVTIVPSAMSWLAANVAGRRRRQGTVLVAGPELDNAEAEVAALADHYPDATRIGAGDARAEVVSASLDGADLAHVAAHGRFRADNPLFSSIDLADGPLMVYDLE